MRRRDFGALRMPLLERATSAGDAIAQAATNCVRSGDRTHFSHTFFVTPGNAWGVLVCHRLRNYLNCNG